MTSSASTALKSSSIWRRLANRFWGYDYFISYHWESGGAYAVALAQRLRDKNYEVFLDRGEFAMGDNWKGIGEQALRNTQRLVLIATREAVTVSLPVEHEISVFSKRGRQVVPIVFTHEPGWPGRHSMDGLNRSQYRALQLMSESTLYIQDEFGNLKLGPTDSVVQQLTDTHRVMRRRNVRALAIGLVAVLLIAFSAFSTASWFRAHAAQLAAEASRELEQEARIDEQKQRERAEDRTRVAEGARLAAESRSMSRSSPALALLLAVSGVEATRLGQPGGLVLPQVKQVLLDSLNEFGGLPVATHPKHIRCSALDASRRWLATADDDANLLVTDLTNEVVRPRMLKLKSIIGKEEISINAIALARDGISVAVALQDLRSSASTIELLTLDQSKARVSLNAPTVNNVPIQSLVYSHDGLKLLASEHPTAVPRVWDLSQPTLAPKSVATVPAGLVASTVHNSLDRYVVRWGKSLKTGELFKSESEGVDVPGFDNPHLIGAILISRDGKRLITSSLNAELDNFAIRVYETADLKRAPVMLNGHTKPVKSLGLSDNGRYLASVGEDKTTRVWDLDHPDFDTVVINGPEPEMYKNGDSSSVQINALVVTDDGRRLFLAAWDESSVSMYTFEPPKARKRGYVAQVDPVSAIPAYGSTVNSPQSQVERLRLRGHEGSVTRLELIGDNQLVSIGRDFAARVWNINCPSAHPARYRTRLDEIKFGKLGVVIADSGFNRGASTIDLQKPSQDPSRVPNSASGRLMRFDSRAHRLVSWNDFNLPVVISDLSQPENKPVELDLHKNQPNDFAITSDGRRIAWLDSGSLKVIDTSNNSKFVEREVVANDKLKGCRSIALRGDGALVAMAVGTHVELVNLAEPNSLPTVLSGSSVDLHKVVLSENGTCVTAQGKSEVFWWDATQIPASPIVFRYQDEELLDIDLSADGKWLAAATKDTACVWSVEQPALLPQLRKLSRAGNFPHISLSYDGSWLATCNDHENIETWDLRSDYIEQLIALARNTAGRDYTASEREQYFPLE